METLPEPRLGFQSERPSFGHRQYAIGYVLERISPVLFGLRTTYTLACNRPMLPALVADCAGWTIDTAVSLIL